MDVLNYREYSNVVAGEGKGPPEVRGCCTNYCIEKVCGGGIVKCRKGTTGWIQCYNGCIAKGCTDMIDSRNNDSRNNDSFASEIGFEGDKKYIWIGGGVVVLLLIGLLIRKKMLKK